MLPAGPRRVIGVNAIVTVQQRHARPVGIHHVQASTAGKSDLCTVGRPCGQLPAGSEAMDPAAVGVHHRDHAGAVAADLHLPAGERDARAVRRPMRVPSLARGCS